MHFLKNSSIEDGLSRESFPKFVYFIPIYYENCSIKSYQDSLRNFFISFFLKIWRVSQIYSTEVCLHVVQDFLWKWLQVAFQKTSSETLLGILSENVPACSEVIPTSSEISPQIPSDLFHSNILMELFPAFFRSCL